MSERQRSRLARALAQAIGGLDGFQVVGPGRVGGVHKGQQGSQLGEHDRPSGMDPAALITEPEALQFVVVFVLYVHVGVSPGVQLASASIRCWSGER